MAINLESLQSIVISSIIGELATDIVNLKFYIKNCENEINPNLKLLDNQFMDNVYWIQQFLLLNEKEFCKLIKEAVENSFSREELENLAYNSLHSSAYKKLYNYFQDIAIKSPNYYFMFMIFEFKVKGFKSQLEEKSIEHTSPEI